MALNELNLLVFLQIGMDVAIFVAFVFLIKRFRTLNREIVMPEGLKTIESVLTDADKIAAEFKEQLKEKDHLIQTLNQQLDKKIMSINVFLTRADVLIEESQRIQGENAVATFSNHQDKEIIKLASEGRNPDYIANVLSLPKEEVKLVLTLRKKITQLDRKKGVS